MKTLLRKIKYWLLPELKEYQKIPLETVLNKLDKCTISPKCKLHSRYYMDNVSVGDFTYISTNSNVSHTTIGKFCSIGPNFVCGIGSHPTNGISTAPMFYSATNRSNGTTICSETKFQEYSQVTIGNDVFIGANVFVDCGVTIGNGAVVAAGAVVVKDVPPYTIVGGVPAKTLSTRQLGGGGKIEILQKIEWWNFDEEKLQDIEKYFFDIDAFIEKYQDK